VFAPQNEAAVSAPTNSLFTEQLLNLPRSSYSFGFIHPSISGGHAKDIPQNYGQQEANILYPARRKLWEQFCPIRGELAQENSHSVALLKEGEDLLVEWQKGIDFREVE
jgi:hypothetical protein